MPQWRKKSTVAANPIVVDRGQMGSADHRKDTLAAGLRLKMAQNIDQSGVGTADHHQQPPWGIESQRKVVEEGIGDIFTVGSGDQQVRVAGFEAAGAGNLSGEQEPRYPLPEGADCFEAATGMSQVFRAEGAAVGTPLVAPRPAAGGEDARVGVDRQGAARGEDLQQTAAVVGMAVAENNAVESGEILAEEPGVVDDRQPLAGIEQVTPLVGLQQAGETVLADQTAGTGHGILAKNGQLAVHQNLNHRAGRERSGRAGFPSGTLLA